MSIERGKWIDFEGPGRSGKSTQIKNAQDFITSIGKEPILTREPGGTPDTEKLRDFIFRLRGMERLTPDQQVALFFASRYITIPQIIKPAIESGVYPLTDRSYPSTNAYQGYAEGADRENIAQMANFLVAEYQVKPSGVIFLDISADEVVARRNKAGSEGDPFDEQQIEYTEKLINGYREMASQNWGELEWYVINGEQPINVVTEDVKAALWEIVNQD